MCSYIHTHTLNNNKKKNKKDLSGMTQHLIAQHPAFQIMEISKVGNE